MTNQLNSNSNHSRASLDPFDLVAQLPNLATLQQAADALGIHKNTIRNWITLGHIQAVRAGGSKSRVVRIPRDAVAEILRKYQER